jgi:Ca2+-binding RTX toxin-like protein
LVNANDKKPNSPTTQERNMTERTGSDWPVDGLEPIVVAQAESAQEASGQPRVLVQEPAAVEEVEAVAAPAATPVDPETLGIAPVDAGERRVIAVTPGTTVVLDDPAFDPSRAVYAVDGLDLVVTQPNGGVLVLVGFFAPSEAPPELSVLGAPATSAPVLLQQAEAAPVLDDQSGVEPAAGPVTGPQGGGGAGFTAYDAGSIGEGLDPLGPLGPTSLLYSAPDPEVGNTFVGDEDDNGGINPPPPTGPVVTMQSNVSATVGEVSGPGFNPKTTPVLPLSQSALTPDGVDREGLSYQKWLASKGPIDPLALDSINSVDEGNVTLDIEREVFIRFVNENSYSVDSVFVHDIAPDGSIVNVRLAFDGTNVPQDAFAELKTVQPGTEISLGRFAAGTPIGILFLNDGFRENDFAKLQGGRYEVRDPLTGEIAKITDVHPTDKPQLNPLLVHIADDGTETVLKGQDGNRIFSADATPASPNQNVINPDGLGHFVSGWDAGNGLLLAGVDDGIGTFRDLSFDDLVIGVRFGSPLNNTLVIEAFENGVDIQITDADSTEMASATIALNGFAGDTLLLDPSVAAGTGITVTQVSDTLIELQGLASIDAYQQVINAASIGIDLQNPEFGERQIEVGVTDPDGLTGTGTTTIDVQNNLLTGPGDGSGNDTIIGTAPGDGQSGDDVISGRGGDDTIFGMGGNDFVDGGDGLDTIDVSQPGMNTVIGGPQPDRIVLGPGADVVRITGLSDGADTISFFNASEGDKLDLVELFRDSDITVGNIADYVQTGAISGGISVQVDLDGRGGDARFVDIAYLQNTTGVVAGGDPSSFVIIPGAEPPVS